MSVQELFFFPTQCEKKLLFEMLMAFYMLKLCFYLFLFIELNCFVLQGKQRVVRRDSVVQVELAELKAELDLDVFSRLGTLSKAFSHCPSENTQPGAVQVP